MTETAHLLRGTVAEPVSGTSLPRTRRHITGPTGAGVGQGSQGHALLTSEAPSAPITGESQSHRETGVAHSGWAHGTVAWFDAEKGFGFIHPDQGQQDIFVEYSTVQMPGYKILLAGQRVTYTAENCARGPEATGVRIGPNHPQL